MSRSGLVGGPFRCVAKLISDRPQRRQDGHTQLSKQDVAVVAETEVGSFVSEDGSPFRGRQGREKAGRDDHAARFGWHGVGDRSRVVDDGDTGVGVDRTNRVLAVPQHAADTPADDAKHDERGSTEDGVDLMV